MTSVSEQYLAEIPYGKPERWSGDRDDLRPVESRSFAVATGPLNGKGVEGGE